MGPSETDPTLERLAVGLRAADADGEAEFGGEGGFGVEGEVGFLRAVRVGDLDVVGFVAGHHLVSRDAVGHGVHDRPLHRRLFPAAFRFRERERDYFGAAEVHLEFPAFNEDAAPDDFTGFGDAAHGAATKAEIHRRLAERVGASVSADVVRGRGAARDQKHPYIFVGRAAGVGGAPTQIVERVFDGLAEGGVDAIGEEAVEAGAFVDLVEVGEWLAGADNFTGGVFDGWAVAVVENTFDEVARGEEVFEALLVLDTDGLAAEFVGDAEGGDVGFTLPEHLRLGELGFVVGAEVKLHALLQEPLVNGLRFGVGDLRGAVVEGGLREALFVDAGLEEEFVGDDGVIHTHAALVEDAHNGFPAAKIVGDFFGDRAGLGRDAGFGERLDVSGLVRRDAGGEPGLQAGEKIVVGEIVAPERGVFHAGFGERAVEI